MKRLTFDGNFCDIAMCQETRGGSFCEDGYCAQRKVWERLKNYEDAEEQGLLVRLPCKLGGTVYDISEFVERTPYAEMYEFHADYIGIGKSDDGRTVISIDCMDYYMDDFGRIVFTSREAAEKALEKA